MVIIIIVGIIIIIVMLCLSQVDLGEIMADVKDGVALRVRIYIYIYI